MRKDALWIAVWGQQVRKALSVLREPEADVAVKCPQRRSDPLRECLRELPNLRRLPAPLTTAQTAASLRTEAASTTFRCWLVRAALAAWQPTAQCGEVFRDCGGARTAADTKLPS